jgi:hypothetical protein
MKIQFEGGHVVEFDGQPTEDDIHEIASSLKPKQMFSSEAEGRAASKKAESFRKQAAFEASPVGFPVTQGLAAINRGINVATMNLPENLANIAGYTTQAITESDISKSVGEAAGFVAPTGAPMKVIKAAEIIKNPLTRSVVQGAGAMATQLPTEERGVGEYATGVAVGGGIGLAGRGVEKVAEGAIQEGAKAVSGRIHDYLIKLPTSAFKFAKNPIKVASDESIVAGNMGEYEKLATERLATRQSQLEAAIQDSDKSVDISEMVQSHFNSAKRSLSESFKPSQARQKLEELDEVMESIYKRYGDLKNVPIQDAIKIKRQLADDFPFTQEGAGDMTTKAAHKVYHDINKFVEEAHPEIAELNERVSGLIDIKNAARNRMVVESRNNPLGLVARLGATGAAAFGIGIGHSAEGIISALGIMGVEKAMQSPAVLTRIAKALSVMSADDKAKVIASYPKLAKKLPVIKVDPRDVDIIPGNRMPSTSVVQPEAAPDIIETTGRVVVPELPASRKPALPKPEPEYLKERAQYGAPVTSPDPKAIRMRSEAQGEPIIAGESVTPERMPMDKLEQHIEARYEAGASQRELDALETLYAKRVAGEKVPYPEAKATKGDKAAVEGESKAVSEKPVKKPLLNKSGMAFTGKPFAHGTTEKAAKSILQKGFDDSKISTGSFHGHHFVEDINNIDYGDKFIKGKFKGKNAQIFDFTDKNDLNNLLKKNPEIKKRYDKLKDEGIIDEKSQFESQEEYNNRIAFEVLNEIPGMQSGKKATSIFEKLGYKGVKYRAFADDASQGNHIVIFRGKDVSVFKDLLGSAGSIAMSPVGVVAGVGAAVAGGAAVGNASQEESIVKAENSKSDDVSDKGATGVMQVTPIALLQFNLAHRNKKYSMDDMKNDAKNKEVGEWYLNEYIPTTLKKRNVKVNSVNRMIAYNAGPYSLSLKDYTRLPKETVNYIIKNNADDIEGISVAKGVDVFDKKRKDAEKMQLFLNKQGFYKGKIDNDWGPLSKAAFIRWIKSLE